ncbi:MAG TPA: hypothetical protein VLC08_13785 [Chitinolyticbacter sp.]|nr:hypothetical protein [Chitinolyticbacter sp.]
MSLRFPVAFSFKVLAIAQQLSAREADGTLLFHAKQKLFKFKEAVTLFADEAQTRPLYRIAADRIIDFSASYSVTDQAGSPLVQLRRRGMRSL